MSSLTKPIGRRSQVSGGEESRAVQIASGGLRTTQDFMDVGAAMGEDMLMGTLSPKISGPVCRSLLMTVRVAEFEQRNCAGRETELADSRRSRGEEKDKHAAIAAEEAALLEQLSAVRKERAAT